MAYGAGFVAAVRAGAELVDPRGSAAPEIAALFADHPQLGPVLPAAGYGDAQRAALRRTIEGSAADFVVAGTPIDLARVLGLEKPVLRVSTEFEDLDRPGLAALLDDFVARRLAARV
jgi:predicted GTPase